MGQKAALEDVCWQDWVEAIQVNLIGTVYCCRVFLPLLKRSERGKNIDPLGWGRYEAAPISQCLCCIKSRNRPVLARP